MKNHQWREFIDFAKARPEPVPARLDSALMNRVREDLQPSQHRILGKFTAAQVLAGLATLTVCPQFGFGFGGHNAFLHSFHATAGPVLYYMLCGAIFMVFGALAVPLLLTRDELRTVRRTKYAFYLGYSLLAYMALTLLGDESFHVHGLCWLAGALAGNSLGFTLFSGMKKLA